MTVQENKTECKGTVIENRYVITQCWFNTLILIGNEEIRVVTIPTDWIICPDRDSNLRPFWLSRRAGHAIVMTPPLFFLLNN